MKRIIAILIVSMMILISCGKKEADVKKVVADKDGVKNYTNTLTPADPTAKLELTKLFTISGESEDSLASFNQPFSMTADKDGNIYILDMSSMSLKKFDKEGLFIKSIGRRGQGPGELSGPSFVAILGDTLSVMSQRVRKISRFTLDGEYIDDKRLEMDVQLPKTYDNRTVIGYTVTVDQENQAIKFSLSLMDKNFKITSTFEKRDIGFQDFSSGKVKISDLLIPFVPGDDKVYLSENDDNQYKINEYNMSGKKTASIKKDYRKIKNSDEEQEAFKAYLENNNRGMNDGS
ncbi:MAG: 6-bladed beta-propeller, partial [Candidatus Delongbacteria bacterium]|nr:6-bladed beta-propeller [Candidatus Delongbacteria bacterium]